jgi:transmembrane sensor
MSAEGLVTEAAAWKVRLHELGVESSLEFEAWLAADPAHADAWRQVEAPWELFGDQASAPAMVAARRDALARAHARARPRYPAWAALAASIALLLSSVLAYGGYLWWSIQPDIYLTGHGERRVVVLEDGSRLSLDAETEVRVRLQDNARELELVKGQARFDVAHDARRPFSVKAAERIVVALGTAFNIDLIGRREPRITLIKGKVEVLPANRDISGGAAPRPLILAPGQQLSFQARRPQVTAADMEAVTTWTTGQLMFDDEPLGSVILRVNRYASRPISVSDDAATLRVSGVFQADDPDGFVEAITSYLPVRARADKTGGVEIVRKEQ